LCDNVTKKFGDTTAVEDVSLKVEKGEFFTLLGPSGCGKTTTLRLITGFLKPDRGSIYFGDKLVNDIPAYKRGAAMVFQSYALFPHMTVFENMEFGLRIKHLPKNEIEKRVKEKLDLVCMSGYEKRMPKQMSSGEQQRIALARALVIEPNVLLLDEPLSNLDAKLRQSMRDEIRDLQKKLKITTIYVTHDQEEALVISDRVAVMRSGKIVEVGSPLEIYLYPKDIFTADFIGLMNFIEGTVSTIDEATSTAIVTTAGGLDIRVPYSTNVQDGEKVRFSIRPEDVRIFSEPIREREVNLFDGTTEKITFLGPITHCNIRLTDDTMVKVNVYNSDMINFLKTNKKIKIKFPIEKIRLFHK